MISVHANLLPGGQWQGPPASSVQYLHCLVPGKVASAKRETAWFSPAEHSLSWFGWTYADTEQTIKTTARVTYSGRRQQKMQNRAQGSCDADLENVHFREEFAREQKKEGGSASDYGIDAHAISLHCVVHVRDDNVQQLGLFDMYPATFPIAP